MKPEIKGAQNRIQILVNVIELQINIATVKGMRKKRSNLI